MSWDPRDITRLTADMPGIGGTVKEEPEAFRVEEIPLYEACGEGEHVYLLVEKRDVSARQLTKRLSSHFGLAERKIGVAGMKDRRAITRQWVSLHDHDLDPDSTVGPIADDLAVIEASRHRNKLRTGHLLGNRFTVEIRDVDVGGDEGLRRARSIVTELAERGVPNYFGAQRFGRDLSTLQLGLELVRGNPPARLRKNKWLKRLAASAAQSALFNWVLDRRIRDGTTLTALVGDRLNRTTERGQLVATAENLAEAQQAIERGELVPTGPMFGEKMYDVSDETLAIEERALAVFGLTRAQFDRLVRVAAGTRRDLMIRFLEPPNVTLSGEESVSIGFSLPSGAYATIVLGELTKLDYSAWEAP